MTLLIGYAIYLFGHLAFCASRGNYASLRKSLLYQVLIGGAFFMLLPFYWMVITSFKEGNEALAYPPTWWPEKFRWSNYVEAWQKPEVGFARYYWVTISTSVAITIGTLVTGVLAAFAFACMRFLGQGLFFYLVLATLMVPGQVLIIPNYIILKELNWLNTYSALIVPWMASVFSIFLMRQHFKTIPSDLWDAAQIDGAGRLRFLIHVVLPLSKPVMISSSIFNFVTQWNSLLWPLVVTSRPEMRTLMVGLQVFSDSAGGEFHLLMAASTFSIAPLVIMFFFLQRFFIEGIARSGMK
jgi:multiple sugar transport system permease protein